jgi:hypothetical protein
MRVRLLLLASAVVVIGAIVTAGAWQLSRVGVHQGYAPVQPLAFSHKIHAGDSKIPCLYCHFGARQSRHAGIPPVNVCMNCHSMLQKETLDLQKLKEYVQRQQSIEWVKVHNLPDFVYFNHSQHVLSSVTCQECHGPIETMSRVRQEASLTMGWCLDCHRQRGMASEENHMRAQAVSAHAPLPGLDCGKCHY